MDFVLVPVAEADVATLIKSIDRVIINPIILFMFTVAVLFFLYGVAQYFLSPDSEEVRKKSKTHMLWGIIGLFIMTAVFGIMRLILGTIGENKIKINSNGDFVVDGSSNPATNVANDGRSDKDLFGSPLDIGGSSDTPQYPPETFTTDPFATYETNPMCWRPAPIYYKAATEYQALQLAKASAHDKFLKENGLVTKDLKDQFGNSPYDNSPKVFESKVLYDKKNKLYYAWLDIREPIKGGTSKDCNLKVLAPARILPDSSIEIDIPPSIVGDGNPRPDSYTTNPFPSNYISRPAVCWRWYQDKPATGSTEYNSLQAMKKMARQAYLNENNLSESTADPKLPTVYGVLSSYNPVNKTYYVWQDVRAPVGPIDKRKPSDCNLIQRVDNSTRSLKPNPLKFNYVTDGSFYRVMDSGVDTTYVGARSRAIGNALIQLAELAEKSDTASIVYRVLPEEKYYAKDPVTGMFDYWLAIESAK